MRTSARCNTSTVTAISNALFTKTALCLALSFAGAGLLNACSDTESNNANSTGGSNQGGTGGQSGSSGSSGSGGSGATGPAIIQETFLVKGATAPPNPDADNNASTPDELNQVRVVRYRIDSDPPKPARAIVVMMPGFLGGGPSFTGLAKALVSRSTENEAIECWAIDRRSNLLEDHTGHDAAEEQQKPSLIQNYYFDNEPINGKTFDGFVTQYSAAYISEWGVVTTLGDLRAVIELIPKEERKPRVILAGHSLGASLVEEYAAWDFDGTPGYSELAGLVLIDGVSGSEGAAEPPLTQSEYEDGGQPAPGGFGTAPGINDIRQSQRYYTIPLLGGDVYPIAAMAAMRALWEPEKIIKDEQRDRLLGILLGLDADKLPSMTNRAALGLAFDEATNGLSFASVSVGRAKGGPMETYQSLLGVELQHPSDPSATYTWEEYDSFSPPDHTKLDDLANVWFAGKEIDFAEWYFPQRIPLDAGVAGTLILKEGDWAYDQYGMRAIHGKSLDLPIYAYAAAQIQKVSAFDNLKKLVADVPIGPGRPLAGAARTEKDTFVAEAEPTMTHIDPMLGVDDPDNLSGQWFSRLADWILVNTPEGGISIEKK